ncbi:Hsp70 family protein [Phytomonospora endophytica]|uniref:Hsp70 family protein n=1 Tax=Phytomonospora endophytica TaxID=714109 RepID=A0A841FP14_9ACTN|nr:Hsp70 family protein [Phytomonospora endophytica]MBB6037845.1 hypothetical protein [Phytomonospora endophytica]GIG68744.1 hypothetical protein Pen01_50390 [Phytomonospora endophytica]
MPPAYLGIDFGTSHTVAVLRRGDGRVETLVFDGSPLLPSGVYLAADGSLSVGVDAAHSARLDPSRFEPNPKRRVEDGSIPLGGGDVAVIDVFAAVLGRVREECVEIPAMVCLTHPATWGPARRRVLKAAAAKAGLTNVLLLPEPVAAARYHLTEGHRDVPIGSCVVVYDFGGGSFDVSVVRRTTDGFELLAASGLDDLGGVDIDDAIVRYLRDRSGDSPLWQRLLGAATPDDRRHLRTFRDDVRLARERLSRRTTTQLHIPVLDTDVPLTRAELERIATPMLARAVSMAQSLIDASAPPDAIAEVVLTGGASRMPLVATLLRRVAVPTISGHVERAVAYGAIIGNAGAAPMLTPPVRRPLVPVVKPVPPTRPMIVSLLIPLWILEVAGGLFADLDHSPTSRLASLYLPAMLAVACSFVLLRVRRAWTYVTLLVIQFCYIAANLFGGIQSTFEEESAATLPFHVPHVTLGLLGALALASASARRWFRFTVPRRRYLRWIPASAFATGLLLVASGAVLFLPSSGSLPTGLANRPPGAVTGGVIDVPEPLSWLRTAVLNGRTVVVGATGDGRVEIWDAESGESLGGFDADVHGPVSHFDTLPGANGPVAIIAWEGDGEQIVIHDLAGGGRRCGIASDADLGVPTSGLLAGGAVVVYKNGDRIQSRDVEDCTLRLDYAVDFAPANIVYRHGNTSNDQARIHGYAGSTVTAPRNPDTGAPKTGGDFTASEPVTSIGLFYDGSLAVGTASGFTHWNPATGQRGDVAVDGGILGTIAVPEYGERLYVAYRSGRGLRIWDLQEQREIAAADIDPAGPPVPLTFFLEQSRRGFRLYLLAAFDATVHVIEVAA